MGKRWNLLAAAWMAAAFLLVPTSAEAEYASDTDTNANVLDYIENYRRNARENYLTEEQLRLMEDAKEMTAHLRKPIDPSKPSPMAVEGDDMFYDERTGDVYARGDVRVTSADARRFESEEARGNLKTEQVQIDGKAHMLQMTPGQMRTILDGYRVVYHYGKKTGKMEEARGKIDHYYIYGRRIEFYPEKIVVFDGYQTRCGAKTPDYRVSGDLIEIYPNHEILVYQAKYWIKNKIVYARDYYRIDISPGAKNDRQFPRVGYSNSDGVWVKQRLNYDLARRVNAFADLKYYTKHQFRNVYGLEWSNAGSYATVQYGYYEDSDDNWIEKQPTFIYRYSNRIGRLPFTYSLSFEGGRWSNKGIDSTHTYYGISLSPYTIKLGSNSWRMNASVGYGITRESYDHSDVRGFSYGATMIKDFGPDVTAYVGYQYSESNKTNSLFAYNTADYAKRLYYGVSVALTKRDRVVFGQAMDLNTHTVRDIDYYWFHDMHCAQIVLRYRAKRDSWHVSWAFTPW